jgi:hypothetical protein
MKNTSPAALPASDAAWIMPKDVMPSGKTGSKAPAADDAQKVIDDLHRKIGQLQVECDLLAGQPTISRCRLSIEQFFCPTSP